MDPLSPLIWMLALGIAFGAGIVKGAIGFALPLVMISGLSSFLHPHLALAGMLISVLLTNLWQVTRFGWTEAKQSARLHWRYILTIMVVVFGSAQLVTSIPADAFYFVLGVPTITLSLIQLAGVRIHVPPARRIPAEWAAGFVSGIFGGLAGTWGPTTALYLLAVDTPKSRQMVVQGVIYGAGSVILVLAHLRSGILNAETAVFSAALLPAALGGMAVGFRLQDKMDHDLFRKVTLIVLVIAGANLIRKGFIA